MEIFTIILVILFFCRIFAEISERLGQPALVGELVAGIFLGLCLKQFGTHIGLSIDFANDKSFQVITDLGIFFLMLLAGLELRPRQMTTASKSAFGIAVGGLLLPFFLGYIFGYCALPESIYKTAQMLFLGTALAITAVPVAVRVLMDLGKLDTVLGRSIVSAAVIDDVLSLMLLAVLTGIIRDGSLPSLLSVSILILKVLGFFVVCTLLGKYVFPKFTYLLKKGKVDEGDFGGLLLMGLSFALLAKVFALHFIIGAFLAGLIFQREEAGKQMFDRVEKRVHGITSGFLAPIFFASIGLHVTFGALFETPFFTVTLLMLAIIGKVFGAGVPAYIQHRDLRKAAVVGVAMNGRGAVELIIVDIAMQANLFTQPKPVPPIIDNMFSSIVIMAIVTTMITPVILKCILGKK